jgi:hypothetical protein
MLPCGKADSRLAVPPEPARPRSAYGASPSAIIAS